MNDASQVVERLAAALALLNPSAVLERGYAIVATPDGAVVSDASHLRAGDDVRLTLARGRADARIKSTESGEDGGS